MEPAAPGDLIAGRYRLAVVIGQGGMGTVWRARDELLDRDVAVKAPAWPACLSARERQTARDRAAREARVAARLNHRNVIRVFDIIDEADGRPWIVMELLAPRSLRDVIREEGPLSPARAAAVGLDVLAALRAAHAAGIVHRDVKPANILMAPGRAVLTDFGIARSAGAPPLSTAGGLIGSPSYIAPERALGWDSGPRADLWGLGVTLYAAVEGHGPFDRDGGALASLTAAVADEAEPALHAGPLWPVIGGLLRKDPGERLDAAGAEWLLRRAAAPAAPVLVKAAASPVAPAASRSPQPRVPAATLAASVALVVLAASGAAAGLALTRPQRYEAAPVAARALPALAGPAASAAGPRAPAGGPRHRTAGPGGRQARIPARLAG